MTRLALVGFTMLLGVAAHAELRVVQAEVVKVVPLSTPASAPTPTSIERDCATPRPDGRDLMALLRWDLESRCLPAQKPASLAGYRVYYRWDGRTYNKVMQKRPGSSVLLRLSVE